MSDAWRAVATELVTCLKHQREQFQLFLDLLARQCDALVSRDTEALELITAEQERAIARSRQIEAVRRDLTARLARLGEEGSRDGSTLPERRERSEAPDATELTKLKAHLQGLHREVERRGRLNASLVEETIRCTGETLRCIARAVRPKAENDGSGVDRHPQGLPSPYVTAGRIQFGRPVADNLQQNIVAGRTTTESDTETA